MPYKKPIGILFVFLWSTSIAQIDTSYVYKTGTPFGTLDIRIAKSPTQFYYLQENKTISYRESSPGIRTNTYLPLTSWNSSDYTQGNLREKSGSNDNFTMNYRLLFPQNYNANYSPGYPIIIMLHGLGERGNCWDDKCYFSTRGWNYNSNTPNAPTNPDNLLLNNDLTLMNGGGAHLNARNLAGSKFPDDVSMPTRAFPGFVLLPQNLNGWSVNSVQDAIRLMRLIIKKYNVDENRIYIEGISNGGSGTFEALKRAPWLFAAALTMSPISDASIISEGQASNIADIPLWIFQGGKDSGPKPSYTENNIKILRSAGASVRYSLYPNLGHGTWNTAYKEPDFFSWMLSKTKTNIHAFANNTAICLTNSNGVELTLATGFPRYEWERDGVIIEGELSSTLIATTPGAYRARFSRVSNPLENQWNPWSLAITITQQTPAQANMQQIGTVLLPDLNGFKYARLKSLDSAAHYYWYKDGSIVDFTGDEDDTVRYAVIQGGNGAYTLVTSGYNNCPSPRSEPKYIFFNNQAPVNIVAPTNFTWQAISTSVIKLTWQDNSLNENGFEIWNRKIVNDTVFTTWQMRTLSDANTISFNDAGLEPMSRYQYKIRAVSNEGRSDYTPSATDQSLTVVTTVDAVKPTTPINIKATLTGINTITLSWDKSTDDTGIRDYHIYYDTIDVITNSNEPYYVLTNLKVNTIYNFTVKAEDMGGNLSEESSIATDSTFVKGIYYEHSTGAWNNLDEINWSFPEFTGSFDNFSLAPRTQDDYFNFKFDGYLNITTGGAYQFGTSSSDGSRVMLDSIIVVNNDGIHPNNDVTGETQLLTAGPKRITVTYFEYTGAEVLTVKYKGLDTNNLWIAIPDSALISVSIKKNKIDIVNGILNIANEQSLNVSVYPNPTQQNDINIEIYTIENDPIQIEIIDYIGRSVYRQHFTPDKYHNNIKVTPLENFSGLYLISVIQNKKSIQRKIIIK